MRQIVLALLFLFMLTPESSTFAGNRISAVRKANMMVGGAFDHSGPSHSGIGWTSRSGLLGRLEARRIACNAGIFPALGTVVRRSPNGGWISVRR